MTFQDALKVIKTITVFYQNFTITEEKAKEWAYIIQEYDLKSVMENLKEYVKENKFPPTVADLLGHEGQSSKRSAYLPNTAETMQIQAEQARLFLEAIEGGDKKLQKYLNPPSEESKKRVRELLKGGGLN